MNRAGQCDDIHFTVCFSEYFLNFIHFLTHYFNFLFISRSAHLLSRYRPRAPIIAVTRNGQTARQAHLYRGIFPVFYNKPAHDVWAEDVDLRVNFAMDVGKRTPEDALMFKSPFIIGGSECTQ